MSLVVTYDTEFVENGRNKSVIPISIGLVTEDGREYYAQYGEHWYAGLRHDWVRQNVLPHLRHVEFTFTPDIVNPDRTDVKFCGDGKMLCGEDDCPWKTDETIAEEILEFLNFEQNGKPELWAYYAGYDHVVLAQTFGSMMDMPQDKLPIWTRDLKQWTAKLEEHVNQERDRYRKAGYDVGQYRFSNPPQPNDEHDALTDARWNMLLYKKLQSTEASWGLGK